MSIGNRPFQCPRPSQNQVQVGLDKSKKTTGVASSKVLPAEDVSEVGKEGKNRRIEPLSSFFRALCVCSKLWRRWSHG